MKFENLKLHKELLAGLRSAGFYDCMPVQEQALPVSLAGKDIMVQSKTGSGKTAVFVLTFLERFLVSKENGKRSCGLIIAPTRELAQQIASDAKVLSSKIKGFRTGCFFGGVGYENQRKLLKRGCDLYVGTPGRLLDFISNHELDCSAIDTFVIDEADRMFDMGFYPDIKRIFHHLVPCNQRQTMMFSATLEMRVRELAWDFMNEATEIELEADHITVDSIEQQLYHVAKSDKFELLLQILASEKPNSAVIFTNSRIRTEELSRRLQYNNYNADCISGNMTQSARNRALSKMKNGSTSILVATDVAARGLQIDNLPLVINYDLPEDYENYVHRVGRTARAGNSGKAISFADEEFVYGLEAIEKFIKMKIPVVWPDNLPEVEDLSIGKEWRKIPKKSAKKNTNTVKTDKKPSFITTKPLSQMTEEERFAYYRKKYGFEEKKEVKKKKSLFGRLFGKKNV